MWQCCWCCPGAQRYVPAGLVYFWNAMTAYRKLPFANPLRMARKDCRKAMPSRPWLKAKAQREGFWTRDHEISLEHGLMLAPPRSFGHDGFGSEIPGCFDIGGNVLGPPKDHQTGLLGQVDVIRLCTQWRQQHAVWGAFPLSAFFISPRPIGGIHSHLQSVLCHLQTASRLGSQL